MQNHSGKHIIEHSASRVARLLVFFNKLRRFCVFRYFGIAIGTKSREVRRGVLAEAEEPDVEPEDAHRSRRHSVRSA